VIYGVLGWGPIELALPIWEALAKSLAMQLKIEDMVAERDVVAVRYTETGTARAPFFDKPATGKSYTLVALEWFELRHGKITKRWGARDSAAQSQQLGWGGGLAD
jgi:predicted ester cyclase